MALLQRLRKMLGGDQVVVQDPAISRRRRLVLDDPHPVIYAIGDVHGCLGELIELEERIAADPVADGREKLIVLLGDYVDRGPNSAGVLDYLIATGRHGIPRVCLCGNHDDAMADFVRDPAGHLPWLDVGGRETLASYGIEVDSIVRSGRFAALKEQMSGAIPSSHLVFIDDLPVSVRAGDVLFVHAGIEPGRPLDEQRDTDMMWIREPFISNGPGIPIVVVHGHTPSGDITTGPGRIGIDTAAFMTGRLTALRVEDGVFSLL